MNFIIEPPSQPFLSINGSDQKFPVNRVFCVGRNYADHAREMGHDPDREPPFFFMKPADAVHDIGGKWNYPPQTENLHYECELVVYVSKSGKDIKTQDANAYVLGYGVGLDMTRRDLQGQAKKLGRPWEWGKSFDKSGPCGPIHLIDKGRPLTNAKIWLKVNGSEKQSGDISDLIWSVPEVISIISHSMELKAGDVIMTGTPSGVGPVVRGDKIHAGIDGLGEITTTIV